MLYLTHSYNHLTNSDYVVNPVISKYAECVERYGIEAAIDALVEFLHLQNEHGLHMEALRVNIGSLLNNYEADMAEFNNHKDDYDKWSNKAIYRWIQNRDAAIQDAYYNSYSWRFDPTREPSAWQSRADELSWSAIRRAIKRLRGEDNQMHDNMAYMHEDLLCEYSWRYSINGSYDAIVVAASEMCADMFVDQSGHKIAQWGEHYVAMEVIVRHYLAKLDDMWVKNHYKLTTWEWKDACEEYAAQIALMLRLPEAAIRTAKEILHPEDIHFNTWNEQTPYKSAVAI